MIRQFYCLQMGAVTIEKNSLSLSGANCRLSMSWFVVHSPCLRHLREIADGSHHASAMKQNLCRLLRSVCIYTTVSPCIHTVGSHTPASYSDVTSNTTATPCTIVVHAPVVIPGFLL